MDDRGLRATLLGDASPDEVRDALRNGAIILDVRDIHAFNTGHVPGSLHIPLGELLPGLARIPRHAPVVTCNAEAAESAAAAEILAAHGFVALNGGRWERVRDLLNEPA